MEKYSDKVLKLINTTAKNLADLNDLLRSATEEPTEQEQKDLTLAMLKLTVIIKEFGK